MDMSFQDDPQARAVAKSLLDNIAVEQWAEYASSKEEVGFLLLGIRYAFGIDVSKYPEAQELSAYPLQTVAGMLGAGIHDSAGDSDSGPSSTADVTVAGEGSDTVEGVSSTDDEQVRRRSFETLQKLRPQWKAWVACQADDLSRKKSLAICMQILGCLLGKGLSKRKLTKNIHTLYTGQGTLDGTGWFGT